MSTFPRPLTMNEFPPNEPAHIKRLRDVLSSMGILRACFVDDEFSPQFPAAFSASRQLVVAGNGQGVLDAWGAGTWTADSEEDDRNDAEAQWEQLNATERRELSKKLAALGPPSG